MSSTNLHSLSQELHDPPSSPSLGFSETQGPEVPPEAVVPTPDESLSEQQLRELYDTEEIDRFINLFSAYVTEVRVSDDPSALSVDADTTVQSEDSEDTSDWISVDGSVPSESTQPSPLLGRCISEHIAHKYVVPLLPPAPLAPPTFTFGRLRLTTQRLYLAVQPVYAPFFLRLSNLATWQDTKVSTFYCVIFWTLWYHNMLLPALFFRIFYSLMRRRLFPYPTLAELRERRQEINRANEFGDEVQDRLGTSTLGIKEAWRLFKVLNKSKKAKVKHAKNKGKEILTDEPPEEDGEDHPQTNTPDNATVLDDPDGGKEERDVKRALLQVCSEIADLHERVKNVFIWRRPASSKMYGGVIFFLSVTTMVVPAHYLAKLTYFIGGLMFWHITPIIAALSPSDRARLPPAFADSFTDAEYAMQLISQRVAAGLDVRPKRKKRTQNGAQSANASRVDLAQSGDPARSGSPESSSKSPDKSIDWKKWGERTAVAKAWADERKHTLSGQERTYPNSPSPLDPVGDTDTFPAQHTLGPGLVTLAADVVYFTPILSTSAKVVIQLTAVLGVKKTGLFKGLSIRHTEPGGNNIEEEKFTWVGGRDELFARLIGSGGRKWQKA